MAFSWAGIGIWVNQGNGRFELSRDWGTGDYPFGGFAAAAGDMDQDGDMDLFTQDFGIKLMVNQGGIQGREASQFLSRGGINTPPAYDQGYRDMGGTITLGDLNGDGWVDAFVASCCYGVITREPGDNISYTPSVSWAWINAGSAEKIGGGNIFPLDALDGRPIRQAALGDLDGDGDLDIYAAVGNPTLGTLGALEDLILQNDGMGQFTVYAQIQGNTDSTSVALGDVNGDGRLDALVGTSSGAQLLINQSDKSGNGGAIFAPTAHSFDARQTIGGMLEAGFSAVIDKLLGLYLPYGSVLTKAVFLSDLDGDGDLDALLARLWGAEIWWNKWQFGFHGPIALSCMKISMTYPVGNNPHYYLSHRWGGNRHFFNS